MLPTPQKPNVVYGGHAALFRQVKNEGHSTSLVEWQRTADNMAPDILKGIRLLSLGGNTVPPGKPMDSADIAMQAVVGPLVIAFGDKDAAFSLHLMHHPDWYSS